MMQVLAILAAVLALGGLLYILRHPQWAIVLVLMMFPLEQLAQSYMPRLVDNRSLFNFGVALVALAAMITSFARQQRIFRGLANPVTFCLWGIFAIAFIGLAWTPSPEAGWAHFSAGWPYWVLLMVIAPLLIWDMDDMRRILIPLMVAGTVVSILIMANPNSNYYSGRLTLDLGMYDSSGSNPLELGKLGAIMALAAVLYFPRTRTGFITLVRFAAFFAGLGLAVGSGSRGQVLGAIVAAVIFFPMARKLKNPKQFMITAILFGVMAGCFFLVTKFFIGDQNRERWDIWQMILDIGNRFDMVWALFGAWLEDPSAYVFGLGPGAFASLGYMRKGSYVHNIACEILCEEGIVGAALFIIAMYVAYRTIFRVWMVHRHDPVMRSAITTLGAFCAFALFLALKQGTFIKMPHLFMWLVIAAKICSAELALVREGAVQPAEPPDNELDDRADEEVGEYIDYDERASGVPAGGPVA